MNPEFPLDNDHNVYILGAGFSRFRGLPVISEFMLALRDAHEWLAAQGRDSQTRAVESVLNFRRESMPAAYRIKLDLENIEELFSLASMANDALSVKIREAIAATLDFKAATMSRATTRLELSRDKRMRLPVGWIPQEREGGPWPAYLYEVDAYEFFVLAMLGGLNQAGTPKGKNTFITMNYDTLIEDALTGLKMPFSYGLLPTEYELHNSAAAVGHSDESELCVLKLHGSVNWAFTSPHEPRLAIFDSYRTVREQELVPELIPPTWRKSFSGPLSGVWSTALRQLERATRIIVLGFSLPATDLHFKYLLAAGLRQNLSLRDIVFVNIDPAGIERKAKALFHDLEMRPRVRIVREASVESFLRHGELESCVHSVGRQIDPAIERVEHTRSK
jgi:hypothetical protein